MNNNKEIQQQQQKRVHCYSKAVTVCSFTSKNAHNIHVSTLRIKCNGLMFLQTALSAHALRSTEYSSCELRSFYYYYFFSLCLIWCDATHMDWPHVSDHSDVRVWWPAVIWNMFICRETGTRSHCMYFGKLVTFRKTLPKNFPVGVILRNGFLSDSGLWSISHYAV